MDGVKLEQAVLAFWQKQQVFKKSLEKTKGGRPFVFYEGPPSANAKPGIHHVLARSFKDLIPRFKTMQGYHVLRRAGWDTHGLPIEVQAEKELGLKSKKDIERYGVAEFNEFCRKLVFRYQQDWEKLTERIGFWIDLKHPYITYENQYIEKLWESIKQFHERGLLYKSHKVVPHCPRCGTSLSSHEVAQGYDQITEPSLYVKFKVLDGTYHGTYLVAWTTTPWTLPGNVALAVSKEIGYVRGKIDGQWVIFAKGLLKADELKAIDVKKLIGARYQPLYPFLTGKAKDSHMIVDADFVSTQEGTGVVHTAVMYGEDDYKLADRFDLPKVHTVAEDGTFKDFVKPFAGKFVKDADKDIVEDLKKRGLLFKIENYTHSYPFCWRCASPLIYYAKDSWFVKMSELRKELLANNARVRWVPAHLRDGRFGEFLKEAKDWAFSRERYWGTPLPVWSCKNGHYKVVGSVKELPKKIDDLHRPFIDEITFQCEHCKETMHREPYVCDVWFDSGSMPYASGEKALGRFPADFIAEGIDQTRGWFYTLAAVSTALGDGPSYRAVISHGLVLDEKGQKMSKSKGNVIDPWLLIERHGADALRWYFYVMNQPGDNKAFNEQDLITYRNKTFGLLWNIYHFYASYAPAGGKEISKPRAKFKLLDRWIASRLHETVALVTNHLERYQVTQAARAITAAINELSTWYLRRCRGREDRQFFETLEQLLITIAKLLAPFAPFNAESLYQKFEQGSVHLQIWPRSDRSKIDSKLTNQMVRAREIVQQALRQRMAAGIKVRQPLATLSITDRGMPTEIRELIADEINVKSVVLGRKLTLALTITESLRQQGTARELIRKIQDLRKRAGYGFKDPVKVYYEVHDEAVAKVLKRWGKEIERETLSKLIKGLSERFDEKLEEQGIVLALVRE